MGMESRLGSENDLGSPEPLARRLADGDPTAPRELVGRHHAELYRYARVLLRDASAAEDAVQEAFSKAFAALGRYPVGRIRGMRLRPWLYRITLNVVRDAWRDGQRHGVSVAGAPGEDDGRPEVVAGVTGADEEAWMDVIEALGRLSERQRVAVSLRYLEDLSYAGISASTGWPESTCKTLVRRGIGRLGALLSEGSDEKEAVR